MYQLMLYMAIGNSIEMY